MSALARFARLDRADRRLVVQAALLEAAAAMAIRALRYGAARRLIGRLRLRPVVARDVAPDRVKWAIEAAARRLPVPVGCLPQALAAHAMLAAHGVDADVRIGVSRDRLRSFAHAWVEQDGRIIVGARDGEYLTLMAPNNDCAIA